jgi:hypothetical protein
MVRPPPWQYGNSRRSRNTSPAPTQLPVNQHPPNSPTTKLSAEAHEFTPRKAMHGFVQDESTTATAGLSGVYVQGHNYIPSPAWQFDSPNWSTSPAPAQLPANQHPPNSPTTKLSADAHEFTPQKVIHGFVQDESTTITAGPSCVYVPAPAQLPVNRHPPYPPTTPLAHIDEPTPRTATHRFTQDESTTVTAGPSGLYVQASNDYIPSPAWLLPSQSMNLSDSGATMSVVLRDASFHDDGEIRDSGMSFLDDADLAVTLTNVIVKEMNEGTSDLLGRVLKRL